VFNEIVQTLPDKSHNALKNMHHADSGKSNPDRLTADEETRLRALTVTLAVGGHDKLANRFRNSPVDFQRHAISIYGHWLNHPENFRSTSKWLQRIRSIVEPVRIQWRKVCARLK
jgi:hypothetical protein